MCGFLLFSLLNLAVYNFGDVGAGANGMMVMAKPPPSPVGKVQETLEPVNNEGAAEVAKLHTEALAALVFTVLVIVFTYYRSTWFTRGSKALHRKFLPDPRFDFARVERDDVTNKLLGALRHRHWYTTLIYGPRSCGKTTIVDMAFHNMVGVVRVHLTDSRHDMYDLLAKALNVSGSGEAHYAVHGALKKYKATFGQVAVLIISLEASCDSSVLENVVTECKILSHDLELARIFIDLSNSHSANQVQRNLRTMRCQGIFVSNLSGDAAMTYMKAIMKEEAGYLSDNDKEELAGYLERNLGGNFALLHQFAELLADPDLRPKAKESVEQVIGSLIVENQDCARTSLTSMCIEIGHELGKSMEHVAAALLPLATKMKSEQVMVSEVISALGISETKFVERNKATFVHPFRVDPYTRVVSLTEPCVWSVIEEHIQQLKGNQPTP